jgi:hypothetical protein
MAAGLVARRSYPIFVFTYIKTTMNYKTLVMYNCEKCYFITRNKKDYNRHLLSRKHQELNPKTDDSHDDGVIITPSIPIKPTHYSCQYCNKSFISRTTIYQHKAKCQIRLNQQQGAPKKADVNHIIGSLSTDTTPDTTTTSVPPLSYEHSISDVITKNQELAVANQQLTAAMLRLVQQNAEFQSKMMEMCMNGGLGGISNSHNTLTNCHNPTFNMNLFLNEKCKDAMNMKDFVNSIQLNMTDLENVGRLGYVEGMSNIFIDNLQKTDVYKRPIHCSDIKRETLYVKDNNQWERDGPDHQKMTNAVLAVEQKNVALVNEWAKANPRCMNSNTRENETYFRLSKAATDGEKDGNIDKVIRKVAKKVIIEKDIASST